MQVPVAVQQRAVAAAKATSGTRRRAPWRTDERDARKREIGRRPPVTFTWNPYDDQPIGGMGPGLMHGDRQSQPSSQAVFPKKAPADPFVAAIPRAQKGKAPPQDRFSVPFRTAVFGAEIRGTFLVLSTALKFCMRPA